MEASSFSAPSFAHKKWWTLLGVGLGVFMSTLDSSIVNISLPTLVEQLRTDFATIQWVILSYTLVLTSLMLGIARLGDMLGKKKIYNAGLMLFTLGSLLCGLSPTVSWLIACRALQGLGAAMTAALGTAIVTEVFPAFERGKALGIMGSIVSTGIALGPALGGILIGTIGWRSVFLVNVPVGIFATFLVAQVVPPLLPRLTGQRFDYLGAIILLVTLVAYALGMTLWQRFGLDFVQTRFLLVGGMVGLLFFFFIEWRIAQPMIDPHIFRNVLFSLNLIMSFLVFVVLSANFLMPFFLELVKHYRVEQVGLMMMVYPVAMGLVAPWAGQLSDRFGSRGISLLGLIIIIIGCATVSTLRVDTSLSGFILRIMPLGLGMGMFSSPNNSAIMGAAPPERLGIASGLVALMRTLGQTTGMPLMGALFTGIVLSAGNLPAGSNVIAASPTLLVSGISGVYRTAGFFILTATGLAALALWLDWRKKLAQI